MGVGRAMGAQLSSPPCSPAVSNLCAALGLIVPCLEGPEVTPASVRAATMPSSTPVSLLGTYELKNVPSSSCKRGIPASSV